MGEEQVHKVAVLGTIHDDAMALLSARDDVSVTQVGDIPTPRDVVAKAIADANGVVVRSADLDAALLESAPGLKIVSRHGVGCDSIDVGWLSARGLPMAIAVGGNDRSVAEHTLSMMLMMAKDLADQTEALRNADWSVRTRHKGVEVAGRSLLVVGYGRIGTRVARLAQAFDMNVIACDPYVNDFAPGISIASLEEGLKAADYVTVHVPLNPETRHIIGRDALEMMKPGALLVNCARGGIVDEHAVAEALHSGHLAGFGADVFSTEPVPADNPILSAPNVVLTPHSAASTPEGMRMMGVLAVQNVLDCFDGCLKPDMLFNRQELGL